MTRILNYFSHVLTQKGGTDIMRYSARMDEYGSSSTWRSQSEKIHQESTIVGDEACVNRRFCLRRWGRERPLHTISNAGLVTGKAYFTVRTMILGSPAILSR